MKITDEKRRNFMEIMTKTAKAHDCHVEFETRSDNPDYMKVAVSSALLANHEFIINWKTVESLTSAATRIWASFFESNAEMLRYCDRDVENTRALYDTMTPLNKDIKDVIFNDPATIVFWKDGTKTVVKCGEGDIYDPEKGLAMAIAKKHYGNKYAYYNVFQHWMKKYEKRNRYES